VSPPDTVRDFGDGLDVHLLADEDHVPRGEAATGHGVTAFYAHVDALRFSRHAFLPRVGLLFALSSIAGHHASLLGFFFDVSELRPLLGFINVPSGRFLRFVGAEGLVSLIGALTFLKGHVFKSLLTQIDFVIVEHHR